jgi:hypothetical protein
VRTVSGSAATILSSGLVPLVLLIEMDLSSPLFLNTSNADLVISGSTYYGTKGMGKVAPMQDSTGDVKGMSFELSGAPSAMAALALTEKVQGKAVRIKLCVLDPTTFAVVDVRLRWAGLLDVMTISESQSESGGTATIAVTAEHAGIDLTRPVSSLYSDDEQQRLHSGDLFFQFQNDQVDQRIVWPAREWFQR